MGWFVSLCSEVESPFDFPNICESTNLHNLAMKSEIAVHPHRDNDGARGVLENSFFMLSCKKKKITANVPMEFVDEVNAIVHILTIWCVLGPSEEKKKEHLFSSWFWIQGVGPRWRESEEVKSEHWLANATDSTVTHLTVERCSLAKKNKKVCSYCHRFPLYMSVGKLEQVRY